MIRSVLARFWPCLAAVMALVAAPAIADEPIRSMPMSTTTSLGNYDATVPQPLTIAQQRARFDADQRMLRMQWNKWIGYEPLRPALPNALTNNEMNPNFQQPVRYRPVWGVINNGSRIW